MKLHRYSGWLDPETPILTKKGWYPARRIKRGDVVYDSRGHISKVIFTQKNPKIKQLYKYKFVNGTSLNCTSRTMISNRSASERKEHNNYNLKIKKVIQEAEERKRILRMPIDAVIDPEIFDLYEKQYIQYFTETFKIYKRMSYDDYNPFSYYCPTIMQQPFRRKKLKIHPYIMGVWLALGRKNLAIVRIRNQTVLDSLDRLYVSYSQLKSNPQLYYISNIITALKEYKIIAHKRIPYVYKSCDIYSMFELIRGFVESSGKTKNGDKVIVTGKKDLMQDILEVLYSLNIDVAYRTFRPFPSKYVPSPKLKYAVSFPFDFNIYMKELERIREKSNVKSWVKIESCKETHRVKNTVGIVISSNEHAFLAGYGLFPVKDCYDHIHKRNYFVKYKTDTI